MKHKIKIKINTNTNTVITCLFLLLIFGFGIAFWVIPDTDFSMEENRPLQTFPTVSADELMDGKLSSRLIDYYSDQFPLRDLWISLHAASELGMGRGESGGVLLGEGQQLAVRRFDAYVSLTERLGDTDYYDPAHVQKSLDAIIALDQALAEKDIPLCVLLAPRTIDVTIGDFAYPADLTDRLDATIRNTLDGADVSSVELLATFREMHANGSYVYYRTDHHWTTKGAYTAYVAILTAWGMADEILPADAFDVRIVSDFYGTTYSRAGLYFIAPDELEIWTAKDGTDARYAVLDANGNPITENGFIVENHLGEKDKYSAFLGEARSLLTVTDTEAAARGEARPRLLIAKDSFANTVAPFLARHFDLVMVNVTGDKTDLTTLAAEYECDRVLILCNRENLVTGDCLLRLR